MEAPPGIGPGIKVLQTSALPLGYSAVSIVLGYSIFELTCLPTALKSVDFTGFLLVFLCQRS